MAQEANLDVLPLIADRIAFHEGSKNTEIELNYIHAYTQVPTIHAYTQVPTMPTFFTTLRTTRMLESVRD